MFEDNIENNPRWKEKLAKTHLRFVVSPYHDKDVWTKEDIESYPDRNDVYPGKPKKAHYHVMIRCDDNSTFKTMKDLLTGFGCPIPERVYAPCGMYRYFCHQDDPDKAQYDLNDIRHYNGSMPEDYIMELSKYEVAALMEELTFFIRGKKYTKYADCLAGIIESFPDPKYKYYFMNKTSYFKEIFKDNLSEFTTSLMAQARKAV